MVANPQKKPRGRSLRAESGQVPSERKQRGAKCLVPQAPTLANVRTVFEEVASGNLKTAAISHKTGIATRQVNYERQALTELGLTENRDGPVTPAGRKLLKTRVGSEEERLALIEAISTSPLTRRLGIDVVSFQPPLRDHILNRCIEICPGVARATLEHRVGDMLSWRRQLRIDPEIVQIPVGFRQLSLADAAQRSIPASLADNLWRANPWWNQHSGRPVPRFRRSFCMQISTALQHGLTPVIAVRGPRQVGKTTAHEQIINDLISQKTPPRHILRVQFDDLPSLANVCEPILRIVAWYEQCVLERSLNDVAQMGLPAFIFLDEVQNVADWAVQIKYLVDHTQVSVVITGSSALQLEEGTDSLAGRVHTIDVGTLTLSEIAQIRNGETLPTMLGNLSNTPNLADRQLWEDLVLQGRTHRAVRDRAFRAFSTFGGYPLAHAHPDVPWEHVAAQLNETVIRRVVEHDLETSVRARELDLSIMEVFRLCCRYAGQVPKVSTLANILRDNGGVDVSVEDVRAALSLIERALLVRLVPPLEVRLKKNRGEHKLCLIDHALRASWFNEVVPFEPAELRTRELSDIAGHLVESAVGTCLAGLGSLGLTHFPERGNEPEVDFVIAAGAHRIPVEVKYRHKFKLEDVDGIQHFVRERKYNAPFGILVTQAELDGAPDDVIVVPFSTLLMLH